MSSSSSSSSSASQSGSRGQSKNKGADAWTTHEKLVLCEVVKLCDVDGKNWVSISREMKRAALSSQNVRPRPADWYSQKNCAAQWNLLCETVIKETPSRRKRIASEQQNAPAHAATVAAAAASSQSTPSYSSNSESASTYTIIKEKLVQLRRKELSEEARRYSDRLSTYEDDLTRLENMSGDEDSPENQAILDEIERDERSDEEKEEKEENERLKHEARIQGREDGRTDAASKPAAGSSPGHRLSSGTPQSSPKSKSGPPVTVKTPPVSDAVPPLSEKDPPSSSTPDLASTPVKEELNQEPPQMTVQLPGSGGSASKSPLLSNLLKMKTPTVGGGGATVSPTSPAPGAGGTHAQSIKNTGGPSSSGAGSTSSPVRGINKPMSAALLSKFDFKGSESPTEPSEAASSSPNASSESKDKKDNSTLGRLLDLPPSVPRRLPDVDCLGSKEDTEQSAEDGDKKAEDSENKDGGSTSTNDAIENIKKEDVESEDVDVDGEQDVEKAASESQREDTREEKEKKSKEQQQSNVKVEKEAVESKDQSIEETMDNDTNLDEKVDKTPEIKDEPTTTPKEEEPSNRRASGRTSGAGSRATRSSASSTTASDDFPVPATTRKKNRSFSERSDASADNNKDQQQSSQGPEEQQQQQTSTSTPSTSATPTRSSKTTPTNAGATAGGVTAPENRRVSRLRGSESESGSPTLRSRRGSGTTSPRSSSPPPPVAAAAAVEETEEEAESSAATATRATRSRRRSGAPRGSSSSNITSRPSSPLTPISGSTFESEFGALDPKLFKKMALGLLDEIDNHLNAYSFSQPPSNTVNEYGHVVFKPDDLERIKNKVVSDPPEIKTYADLQRDLSRMFLNAVMFNPSDSVLHDQAVKMFDDVSKIILSNKNTVAFSRTIVEDNEASNSSTAKSGSSASAASSSSSSSKGSGNQRRSGVSEDGSSGAVSTGNSPSKGSGVGGRKTTDEHSTITNKKRRK